MTPAPGAVRRKLPTTQSPQLCQTAEAPPEGGDWLSEIKFDGYRLLGFLDQGAVRLLTRNGHDWSDRLPAVAQAVAALPARTALVDGELVALRPDGVSSFPDLQAALSAGLDGGLAFFLFDLLHLDGWDFRACKLLARKTMLASLGGWQGVLRYSDHVAGAASAMRRQACGLGLEGIVCKRADAPYRGGRGHGWVKVKCQGREEFVVLGWTPPAGSRIGLGALHVGYFDPAGALHYAGGVGTGFTDRELAGLRAQLDGIAAPAPPPGLQMAGEALDRAITWVRPELVAEVQFIGWSGAGRLRHAVYLGLREDKAPREVVRSAADPMAPRQDAATGHQRRPPVAGLPVIPPPRAVIARPPRRAVIRVAGVEITHPDRELWPGITKRALAEYWLAIASAALPGLARRPLAIVRCPDGIAGEHFFQKRGHGTLPGPVRDGTAGGSPYLAIDDVTGLISLAQMAALELHPWGAAESDALHPDLLVFDLDPGEDVPFPEVSARPSICAPGWSNSGSARSAAPRVAAACTSPCRCRRAPTGTRRARSAVPSPRP